MNILKIASCLIFSTLVFTSCKEGNSNQIESEIIVDDHTSQNALDWNGTYVGELKGLENENFSVTLSLEVDGIYSLELNDGQKKIQKRNKFNWSSDGQVIELYDANEILNKFFVGENRLMQLNAQGERPQDGQNELKKLDHEY